MCNVLFISEILQVKKILMFLQPNGVASEYERESDCDLVV